MENNARDVMNVQQIINELEKLIASEKGESDAPDAVDTKDLEEALDLVRKFADEEIQEPRSEVSKSTGDLASLAKPVDTGLLTGPMPALKNFLVKSQRDNESQ